MVFEYLGIPHIAAQRINRAVPGLIHHLEDRGATLGGGCQEARAQ
jgi:hypothetical protein